MKIKLTAAQTRTGINRKGRAGYTLIEALIATSILMLGALAAASLSLTMAKQDDLSDRTGRAMNWHEAAADLYRLGLSSSEVSGVLPPDPLILTHTISESAEAVAGLGSVNVATSTITFRPDPDSSETRSHVLKVLRAKHQ